MSDKNIVIVRRKNNREISCETTKSIDVISSKSFIHRALIIASIASGVSKISYKGISDDIMATISALEVMGAKISLNDEKIIIEPIPYLNISDEEKNKYQVDSKLNYQESTIKRVNCKESGSTLRMLLPLATMLLDDFEFLGDEGLVSRPIGDLTRALRDIGKVIDSDSLPIKIINRDNINFAINDEEVCFNIRGDISSQYISGLLLASPLMNCRVRVNVIGGFESKPYVNLSVDIMSKCGVEVKEVSGKDIRLMDNCIEKKLYTLGEGSNSEGISNIGGKEINSTNNYFIGNNKAFNSNKIIKSYILNPGQSYSSFDIKAQGDWSNASFLLALGAIYKGVRIKGLDIKSSQGDKIIIDILNKYGAKVEIKESYIEVSPADKSPLEVDISDTPDMLPVLSILAIFTEGESFFTGIDRLRIKESDRIESVIKMLESFGARVRLEGGKMIIIGGDLRNVDTYEVDSFNDHRIVMAASIAASILNGQVKIKGARAVNKSYPTFFEDLMVFGFDIR